MTEESFKPSGKLIINQNSVYFDKGDMFTYGSKTISGSQTSSNRKGAGLRFLKSNKKHSKSTIGNNLTTLKEISPKLEKTSANLTTQDMIDSQHNHFSNENSSGEDEIYFGDSDFASSY
jgi:hypothetical protein